MEQRRATHTLCRNPNEQELPTRLVCLDTHMHSGSAPLEPVPAHYPCGWTWDRLHPTTSPSSGQIGPHQRVLDGLGLHPTITFTNSSFSYKPSLLPADRQLRISSITVVNSARSWSLYGHAYWARATLRQHDPFSRSVVTDR